MLVDLLHRRKDRHKINSLLPPPSIVKEWGDKVLVAEWILKTKQHVAVRSVVRERERGGGHNSISHLKPNESTLPKPVQK
jgi:hypothetical protein